MKFLNQLPGKAWIELHEKVFGKDGFNDNFVMVRPCYDNKEGLEVYFKELDNTGEWIEVVYIFKDFYRPICGCSWIQRDDDLEEVERRFFSYMAKRFGEEYIHAFFEERTGAKVG